MDTVSTGWWRRHGWTIAILLLAFGIAFFVRTAWTYPIVAKWGPLYTYAGGSDSFYHSRVMTYIIQTGHNLGFDPMLKYPVGSTNPREPLFDWMNAVLGMVFSPFFGGNAVVAGAWFLDLQPPLWAALTVFPIYLIGREVSSKRTGLLAALIYPFLAGSINSSTFGYANYLSFYTFMLLVVVYSYLRFLKALGHRRWVESYRHPGQIVAGLRGFLAGERVAVKWAVFTGISLGALALSWQGYTYAIVVIGIGLLVAMVIERIRRVDSFGLYVGTWIIGLVAFPMAAPYYIVQQEFTVFLIVPVLLFFGIVAVLLPFLLLRDVPWIFSIPTLVAIVGLGVLALRLLSPTQFTNIVTGQGYFVKTLVYSTVAEAQAPSIDQLVVGYGVVTFFLAFVGLALSAYLLVHHRFKRHHIAFLVYAVVSIYLPVSATKFFLVGTPIFALLSAEALHRALDVGGYPELRRTVASLSDRGGKFAAFRKAFKARHVLIMALAVGLLLPNMWVAVDAGIPGNTKNSFAAQINSSLPSWLKLNTSAPASNYLGEAGSALDTPNQYDSAAYNWLAQQDTNVPEPNRPAFISWWDYGFQAIAQGQHPSVADNFQNGIDPAGQFLLSQNESLAIGILTTTLLQGEILKSHQPNLPASLNAILTSDGVNVTTLHTLLNNEGSDWTTVVNDPGRYLPVDRNTLTQDNAMYLAVSYYLAGHLPLSGIAKVYDDLQAYTGWTIRYAMTDSRLFPFSGSNTGIFYAPADLTGRVIDSAGVPTTFYNVTITGSDGNTYPLGPLPAGVTAANYNLNWSAPFYNTMLYRIYIGYNGTQVGVAGGIPGISGAAAGDPVEPGFMLQHFQIVYRTGYVCPNNGNAAPGSSCFYATNVPNAIAVANKTHGSVDTNSSAYFSGGETLLAYYPGQTLLGRVVLPGGVPVPGAHVTVFDGWGIPHMSAVTAADGSFSLLLPPGNDSINITTGAFDRAHQQGANFLAHVNVTVPDALGYSFNAPPRVQTFYLDGGSVSGVVYFNLANNSSFVPASDLTLRGATVTLTGLGGAPVLSAVSDPSGTFQLANVPPQVYNVSVNYGNHTYALSAENVSQGQLVNISAGLSVGQVSGHVTASAGVTVFGANVVVRNATGIVATSTVKGTGIYIVRQLQPGNYTVGVSIPGSSLRSPVTPFAITTTGGAATVNLSLAAQGTVTARLMFHGAAAPGIGVRFVPEVGLVNGTNTPILTLATSTSATVLGVTDANGYVTVGLGPGPYSIYGIGTVNGQHVAGLGSVTALASASLGPVVVGMSAAVPVHIGLSGPVGPSNASRTAVVAYGPNGSEDVGWAASGTNTSMLLPAGNYSFAVVHGTTTTGSETLAGLAAASVAAPATSLTVPVNTGAVTHFAVGAPTPNAGFQGAYLATVRISSGPTGPYVQMFTGPNGATGLVVPGLAPSSVDGYCVSVTAFGFDPNSSCGWSALALQNLSFYPLQLTPIPVTLTVKGLPVGTAVTVSIVGESPTAVNRTYYGGPRFSFTLPPGRYGVGAKATIGNGTTIYLPPSVRSTTILAGATATNLTLVVVPEINVTGTVKLPVGANYNTTTINLTSSIFNTSVNATNYTEGFRGTPGNYTATISATIGGVRYVNLTRVVVAANGTIAPRLNLSVAGLRLAGTLVRPGGATLDLSASGTLTASGGIVLPVSVTNGTFKQLLPPGSYAFAANGSTVANGPNGSYSVAWSSPSNASCLLTNNSTSCRVAMVGSAPMFPLNGSLVRGGQPAAVSGTVRFVGPFPALNVTVVNVTAGNFTALLAPGAYYAYAASSGTNLAGFARVLALPGSGAASISLAPTWTVTALVQAQGSTSIPSGVANVTVSDELGNTTIYPDVPLGSSVALELPVGRYALNATSPGSLYGVAGTAYANLSVNVLNGNLGPVLGLAVPVKATVAATLSGPTSATVSAGGIVSFPILLTASGNVPVTVHAVGAPTTWKFRFTFSNVTLTPGAGGVAEEVRIGVPNGTFVNHAPVTITFETLNGTSAGTLAPTPTVSVLSYFGVKLYASGSVQVGGTAAKVPFHLRNTGNTFERVALLITNQGELASKGWNASISVANATVTNGVVNLSAGANATGGVNLSTNASVYLPPGAVTIEASVINASGTFASYLSIPVPRTQFTVPAGKGSVTGPSVGSGPSPTPLWLVPLLSFVPSIALVVGLLARRWWKTRRWVRR